MIIKDSNDVIGKIKIRAWSIFASITSSTRSLLAYKTLLVKYSHESKKIVFGNTKEYTAWYTYPFLDFIHNLDLSSLDVFEFGSGYSTLYWGAKANSVTTVEHNKGWFENISSIIVSAKSKNIDLFLEENSNNYINSISSRKRKSYDVIIIDGISRFEVAKASINMLRENGVIILDNSDWCPDTVNYLVNEGFCHIPFSGLGPSNQFTWSTSLFCKTLHNPFLMNSRNAISLGMVKSSECGYMFDGEHN